MKCEDFVSIFLPIPTGEREAFIVCVRVRCAVCGVRIRVCVRVYVCVCNPGVRKMHS